MRNKNSRHKKKTLRHDICITNEFFDTIRLIKKEIIK